MADELRDQAIAILAENDRGAYTVPTKGLYPFQWNWDSCLTALGQRHFDEARAWTEIETLFAHQWPCGMVPHIVFHERDDGYFPGPDVWATNRPVPTSGITQPPVAGFAVKRLFDLARNRAMAADRARALLPKLDAWHRWFHRTRDPEGAGLVAILHPWEAGRDNSADWDEALARVPIENLEPYVRRDTTHVDASQRPTKAEYDRYLSLVQTFRALGWDTEKLHAASPFKVVDPGLNAILMRSEQDLATLAEALGESGLAAAAAARASRMHTAFAVLWDDTSGQYLPFDRTAGTLVSSPSLGGLLPVLAIPRGPESQRIAERILALRARCRYAVPSHDPDDARFDARRYWRGPVWLVTNALIADGLARTGRADVAAAVRADSLALIRNSGFAEYYDPMDGAALGGGRFTWTAAMVLEFTEGDIAGPLAA